MQILCLTFFIMVLKQTFSTVNLDIGITYYPSKDWAIIIPCWCSAFIVFAYWMYESYNMTKIKRMEDILNVRDSLSKNGQIAGLQTYVHSCKKGLPALVDIPTQVTSAVLFANVDWTTSEQNFGQLKREGELPDNSQN
eukprot:TRINITY_DN9654_c0_g1_i2.p3 TRINITY_DN9654_c0_g1~~TRINITY_DN9654_c0_g1_i2.p3  ORF type:complete len:138 (-),score=19.32 TRINITY_DN9654_c0_g1_i2:116-529(-)